ncbi:MAG: tetratricopeptide repeat protein [Desulfobacteraceae bacterium]|nr:YcaO-like family protein [Desulfobacteraceae bacterium]MBC2754111.1 tetratricopeptide repeat protein [Desulfobacteraceae bacterium]
MSISITLKDAYKTFTDDQDKIIAPDETLKNVKHKFNRLDLSILEETVRIDNGRLDIPVYFSVCGEDAARLTGTSKQMGKGATPVQAETSAVMELVERYSFYNFANTPQNFIIDTYDNLKDLAMPFDMIAKSVHDASDDLAKTREFFSDIPMKWTWGYNLTTQKKMLVPFDWFFAINEFNGTSAGNCVEEALCQGICEIVERHVSAIVCREKKIIPGIKPESATDPAVVSMLEKYKKTGINLYVSDFTLGMGIPTVGVMAFDPSTFPEKSEIVWTAGTTPDPDKAFSRALTETAQLAGDFNTRSNFVASGLPKYNSIEQARYITHPNKRLDITELPDISNQNIKVEVENCLSELSKRGFEVITVATTHPKLDLPAFYSVVPGAHFRERASGTSVGMFSCKLIVEKNPPEKAIRLITEIDKTLLDTYYIKFYLGTCHLALENAETAYRCFSQALELNPDKQDIPSIYSYMGICLKDMGDYNGALGVLKKGEAYDRERTDIYNQMGFCYFMLKQHEKAIKCFKQVIALNPSSAIDYANIASNYRDMGDTDNAIAYYQIALSIDPSIDFARTNLEKLVRDPAES